VDRFTIDIDNLPLNKDYQIIEKLVDEGEIVKESETGTTGYKFDRKDNTNTMLEQFNEMKIGQGGNIVDMYGTGMTPIVNLKTAPESYGDGNVIMYFSDLLPDGTAGYSRTSIYNDGANRYDSWKKTKIGIYQGELKPSARIGEQLALNSSATTQTSAGNIGSGDDKYVENNVGILAQSGQRAGIKPSEDLGANVSATESFSYVDKDLVHALYVNDIDVTFGKYSKGNIMN